MSKGRTNGNVRTYRGFTLVEVGHNYFAACKGPIRINIGSMRRGDRQELCERFMRVIDRLEKI